ncbi:uncharacterized protein [Ptychodera flava]|uniref:uncharacterized protein n=1 Tax=Ptychodera flava TaxID=63121 RepID=UPI00396A5872
MYTWWSKSTGLLGETTVVVLGQSKYFTVFGKQNKATSVVFNLDNGPYIDVALLSKTDNGFIDVYNYQPQEGVMLCCSTLVHNIIPSHSGSLYMTTFQDIHCSLVEGYTFIATSVNGETVIRKFDVKLETKGDETVNVTMSYKPYSPGHYAELVCTTLHDFTSVSWTFNGRNLEDDRKYTISNTGRNRSILSISEVWREDIGSYTCKIHWECDVANSSINISYVSLPNPIIHL